MTDKRRPAFACWSCKREYTLLRDVAQAKLIVECPFCGEEGEVDLAPWRNPDVNIMRGEGSSPQVLGEIVNLPDVLPTTPIKAE